VLSGIIDVFILRPIDRGIAQKDLDAKTTLVEAINAMGGSASVSMTWQQLATSIRSLDVVMYKNRIIFDDSVPMPADIPDIVLHDGYKSHIKEIHDSSVLSISTNFFGNGSLKILDTPSVHSVATNLLRLCTAIQEIVLPSCTSFGDYAFYETNSYYKLNLLNSGIAQINRGHQTSKSTYLIDLIIGTNFDGNVNFSSDGYNPSEAYRTDIASLCFDTDLQEYGQIFSTNWDKWKWCIINHLAANLPDRSGLTAFTITFGSTVLSHFDQDMQDAFTNKGWNLI